MRPVCGSSKSVADGATPSCVVPLRDIPADTVPAECPGVFIEQPLERWSPRDLIVGVLRLVRRTPLAAS